MVAVWRNRNGYASDAMFGPGVGRRSRRVLGDFAVLLREVAARRLVAAGPAEQLGRYAPVGALGVVFGSSASLGS
jgi:hypothetical protein